MPETTAPFFIIAGPTAVGKSALAVAVAERCGGEIVGADAFQVYAGLDILTAKPSPELRARVSHHLIGEIPLAQSFDVAQYLRLAREHIREIHERGHLPIVVGGTGLYLRALTHGLADLPPSDATLRTELDQLPTGELCRQLAALDPVGFAQIDQQNRRRLVRALEVCRLTGRPFSSFRQQWSQTDLPGSGVVVTRDRNQLHERIERRTEAMFIAGVEEEVRTSDEPGLTAQQTLGWREIRALLAGTMSRADCLGAITQATRQYAKRQLTWFRREAHLTWVELPPQADVDALADQLARQALAVKPAPRP